MPDPVAAPIGREPAAAALPPRIGRYLIEREIGRGSLSAVYLGRDPQRGQAVAIKTMALAREFEGEALAEARQRFVREARTAGRLDHPGIVHVFDAGQTDDTAYIAMEFMPGHDLLRYTQPGRLLPLTQAVEVAARVADALAYAHRQGVVHRDIKPANVMLDPATGVVKLTDFGMAHVIDASRTRTGLVLGSPSYMAPELMVGSRFDGRSDQYSLGVLLFQLLSGALPHESESMARLMHRIVNEPAPDLRALRPEIPAALAAVVSRMLEKRPETRHPDADLLAADLRRAASAPPSATAPDAVLSRLEPRHNS
jgi:serine/threonine-protein kinase